MTIKRTTTTIQSALSTKQTLKVIALSRGRLRCSVLNVAPNKNKQAKQPKNHLFVNLNMSTDLRPRPIRSDAAFKRIPNHFKTLKNTKSPSTSAHRHYIAHNLNTNTNADNIRTIKENKPDQIRSDHN